MSIPQSSIGHPSADHVANALEEEFGAAVADKAIETSATVTTATLSYTPEQEALLKAQLQNHTFSNWLALETILQGASIIDLNRLTLPNRAEAIQFIATYGFDLDDPDDASELQRLREQATHFIESRLLDPEEDPHLLEMALAIPKPLFGPEYDLADLLLLASGSIGTPQLRPWACAILKVMHTLVHIEHTYHWQFLSSARNQIIQKFKNVLSHDPNTGQVILQNMKSPERHLRLYGVEIKEMKSRESLLIKLLSKKAHVAEQADDLVGLRFITESPVDALLSLELLREFKLFVLPHANPNRSRNSLLDVSQVRQHWNTLREAAPDASWQELVACLRAIPYLPPEDLSFTEHNPHSALSYRSIHLTCRQLIKVPSPGGSGHKRVFFPFELQFIDKANYQLSQQGDASHKAYKQRQLNRARRRVLGDLLPKHFRNAHQELYKPVTGEYQRWLHEEKPTASTK